MQPLHEQGIIEYISKPKSLEMETIISEPVPRENKVLTLIGLRMAETTLKSSAVQTAIIVTGFIVLAITFIGAYFILTGTG